MGREWLGRWGGAACAVAGCAPMLFAVVAGSAGAAGAAMTGMGTVAMGMAPAWVRVLGGLSWPLLAASVLLLLWSFWRAPPPARAVAYAGVALLLYNQLHMRTWLFAPGLGLVLLAFLLARAGVGRTRRV